MKVDSLSASAGEAVRASARHSMRLFCRRRTLVFIVLQGAERADCRRANFYIVYYSMRLFCARRVPEFFVPTARKT